MNFRHITLIALSGLTFGSLAFGNLTLIGSAGAQTAPLQLQPNPPKPGKVAPASPVAAPPATAGKMSSSEAVAKANAFFNGQAAFSAEFVQLSSSGRRTEGELYVQKPGKMHFEYNAPAALQIIADGTSVAIRDKKLATQDLYLISQTPLKFLLSNKLDLTKDTKVLDVKSDDQHVAILIEDKATLGGTSRIRLIFDPATFELKQWVVTDPQGADTVVSLFNVDSAPKLDPELFVINTYVSTPSGKR